MLTPPTDPPATDPLREGDPEQFGPFQLSGRLGAGGMGQVFLGRDHTGRYAAIKVVHPGLAADPQFRGRFAREITTARAVTAPWCARVLAADPDASRPWLATEYIAGPSLEDAVATRPLRTQALGILAARLATALAGLHAAGVVHRDLKPSNVLLAADGPRLIDFGIARAADATRITRTGGVIGTPSYMSPEQASGEDTDAPSDVFSLASVLVFAATGASPFADPGSDPDGAVNPMAVLLRVADSRPDLSGVPESLRPHVEACFARDPHARPSAAALAQRLAGFDPDGAATRELSRIQSGNATVTTPVAGPPGAPWGAPAAPAAGDPARTWVGPGASNWAPGGAAPAGPGSVAVGPRRRPWLAPVLSAVSVALIVALVLLIVQPWQAASAPQNGAAGPSGAADPATSAEPETTPGDPATPAAGALPGRPAPPSTPSNEESAQPVDSDLISAAAVSPDGTRGYLVGRAGVSVIDMSTGAVTQQIELPGLAQDLVVNADGSRLFVLLASGVVPVLNTSDYQVAATIQTGDGFAVKMALSADGTTLHVVHSGISGPGRVVIADVATSTVVGEFPVAEPQAVGLSADGATGFVWSRTAKAVIAYDTATRTENGRFPAESADAIVVAPDGRRGYTVGSFSGVTVFDPATRSELGRIVVPSEVGSSSSVAVSPDSRHLYLGLRASGGGSDLVRVLDAASLFTVEDIEVTGHPEYLAATGDGSRLLAAAGLDKLVMRVAVGGYR